jgi:hypothetical protein
MGIARGWGTVAEADGLALIAVPQEGDELSVGQPNAFKAAGRACRG